MVVHVAECTRIDEVMGFTVEVEHESFPSRVHGSRKKENHKTAENGPITIADEIE